MRPHGTTPKIQGIFMGLLANFNSQGIAHGKNS